MKHAKNTRSDTQQNLSKTEQSTSLSFSILLPMEEKQGIRGTIMKTRLIRIKEIAEISGLSISTIKNYINGGYYSTRGFIPKDVGFPKPAKVVYGIRLFEESKIRQFFNIA